MIGVEDGTNIVKGIYLNSKDIDTLVLDINNLCKNYFYPKIKLEKNEVRVI